MNQRRSINNLYLFWRKEIVKIPYASLILTIDFKIWIIISHKAKDYLPFSDSFVIWNRARIPAKHVYYYRCPDHRKNYVMSFSFCFDREDDVYQFAYCYPYSYTRLQNYLDNLEKKGMDFFHRELLCLTVVKLWTVTINMQSSILYTGLFLLWNILPRHSMFKRNNLKHWNLPSLKFALRQQGRKGQK